MFIFFETILIFFIYLDYLNIFYLQIIKKINTFNKI